MSYPTHGPEYHERLLEDATASDLPFTPNGSIAATNVQAAIQEVRDEAVAGAPTGADYLVGTAQAGLSAEIVVGTTPGGELGGTWSSPTVDGTHSGSTHAAAQAAAEATAATALSGHVAASDPHTGYVREAATEWVDLTDGGATTLHSHAGGSVTPEAVKAAGRWEIVMTPGITSPPEPVWTPDGTDYVYAWVTD